jgi:hypothetical protein
LATVYQNYGVGLGAVTLVFFVPPFQCPAYLYSSELLSSKEDPAELTSTNTDPRLDIHHRYHHRGYQVCRSGTFLLLKSYSLKNVLVVALPLHIAPEMPFSEHPEEIVYVGGTHDVVRLQDASHPCTLHRDKIL